MFAIGATAAVLLSVAQMIQYWIGVLPMRDTTWSAVITGSVPAIPMRRRSWIKTVVGVLAAVAVLAYSEPPWMGGVTSGLRPWSKIPGTLFRWTAGRATFYIPSGAAI